MDPPKFLIPVRPKDEPMLLASTIGRPNDYCPFCSVDMLVQHLGLICPACGKFIRVVC